MGWKTSGGGPSFSCMKKGVGQEKSCNTLGVAMNNNASNLLTADMHT